MDIDLLSRGPLLRPTDKEKAGLHQSLETRPPEPAVVEKEIKDDKPWLSEPNLENVESMEVYLSIKKIDAAVALEVAKSLYQDFREQLSEINPELASKHFGFTVDASGSFRILDPHNNLTQSEKVWLTEQLGELRGFKENLMAHMEASTLLAKHDKAGFLSRYQLDNGKMDHLIDYSAVLTSEDMERAFNEQIQYRAMRKTPFITETV